MPFSFAATGATDGTRVLLLTRLFVDTRAQQKRSPCKGGGCAFLCRGAIVFSSSFPLRPGRGAHASAFTNCAVIPLCCACSRASCSFEPSRDVSRKDKTGNQRRCRFHHWLAGRWGGGHENPPGLRLNAGIPATLTVEAVPRTRLLSDSAVTSAAHYRPAKSECQALVIRWCPTKGCQPDTSLHHGTKPCLFLGFRHFASQVVFSAETRGLVLKSEEGG